MYFGANQLNNVAEILFLWQRHIHFILFYYGKSYHFLSYVIQLVLICWYSITQQSSKCGKDVNGGNYLFKTETFCDLV